MFNFDFYNPTKVLFGENQLARLPELLPEKAHVLLLYGQGSVKRLGILEQIKNLLQEHDFAYSEFGGIKPNPEMGQLVEAIYTARKHKVNYILAIGGGSVIDAAKFISGHVQIDNFDILLFELENECFEMAEQDYLFNPDNLEAKNQHTPFGVVLTCLGTGSEMNRWAVISDNLRKIKVDFGHEDLFPQFTIIDPSLTFSLPVKQIQNGVVDAVVHVFEQYLLEDKAYSHNDVACFMAESLLRVLWKYGPLTVAEPTNYEYRSNFCWAATMALNGYLSVGLEAEDWSTHQIGHMLTAHYGIEHAPSLTAVFISNLQLRFKEKQARLARFAREVLHSSLSGEQAARFALIEIAKFFTQMQMPISLRDYRLEALPAVMDKITTSMALTNQKAYGEFSKVKKKQIAQILRNPSLLRNHLPTHSLKIRTNQRCSYKIVKFKAWLNK
ncbi:hypothetical protein CKF54_06505 [Psittacicella hinzii]|uniref:Uncharacterized protein n=1 Tax=Psittacicella hinzii TaxID=2028575 RepID=A0A3A1Y685_9GAMM|nr:iron-containing alcohol dehydrogenase [Psittacicella hinzii]RIY31564.1 hypothetical protein CKF54_06505 [Psittacicella hinzii]